MRGGGVREGAVNRPGKEKKTAKPKGSCLIGLWRRGGGRVDGKEGVQRVAKQCRCACMDASLSSSSSSSHPSVPHRLSPSPPQAPTKQPSRQLSINQIPLLISWTTNSKCSNSSTCFSCSNWSSSDRTSTNNNQLTRSLPMPLVNSQSLP